MIDKNKTYKCDIHDLSVNGDGITKIDGYTLFVKGAVPGDTVILKPTKLNKNYGFAKVVNTLSPSPYRRKSICNSFPDCGGCSLLNMSYTSQLDFKSRFVLSNIYKIGNIKPHEFIYEGIIGAQNEYYYRNKAQFPVRNSTSNPVCGFYKPKTHSVINCQQCHIQNTVINSAVNEVMNFIKKNNISAYDEEKHTGIVRHIYVRYSEENKNLMVVLVTNSYKPLKNTDALVNSLLPYGLKCLVQNINTKRTNVILGDKNISLYGEGYIYMNCDDLTFKVSPHSFFQVNTPQMKKLYQKVMEYANLSGNETVFDLYCGVGSISLYLAKKAKKVIGVEIVPSAIENAKENASLSGVDNAKFYCGDCTKVVSELIEKGEKADVAVVDPPRKGCDEKLLELINNISPKTLVYVSCNSATMARDIAVLKDFGYKLIKCTAVDLFPQTTHVEAVALLQQLSLS